MIKKIFITILLITLVSTNFILQTTLSEQKESEEIKKRILDMQYTNGLIELYSNLFNELIPANAK